MAFAPPSKVAKAPEVPPTRNRLVLQDAIFDHAIQDGIERHESQDEEDHQPSASNKSALDGPLQSLEATRKEFLEIAADFDVKDHHGQSTNDDDSTIATASSSLSSKTSHVEEVKITSNGHCHTDAPNRVGLFSSWFQRRDTCDSQLSN